MYYLFDILLLCSHLFSPISKDPLLFFHFSPEYDTKGFIYADVLSFHRVAANPYFLSRVILTFLLEAAFLAKFPSEA